MMRDAATELCSSPDFVRQLSSKDPDVARNAVARLARECAGFLLNYLRKTRARHGLVEEDWPDALQEVFARFMHKPPDLDPARPMLPYLRRAVLNQARDMAETGRIRARHEKRAGTVQVRIAAGAETAATLLQRRDSQVLVQATLCEMSENDQVAILAYVEAGPKRHSALLAKRENIDPGAAQMRFSRALGRLKRAVRENGQARGHQ